MTVAFLMLTSIVLWMIPVCAEWLFDFPSHSYEIVFWRGISIVAALWGFRHPWRKMPYVFVLLFAPFGWLPDIRQRLPILLLAGIPLCVIPYMAGRGAAWVRRRVRIWIRIKPTGVVLLTIIGIVPLVFSVLPEQVPATPSGNFRMMVASCRYVIVYSVVPLVWACRYSWRKIPYVVIPLFPSLIASVLFPNAMAILIYLLIFARFVGYYALGRGIARLWRWGRVRQRTVFFLLFVPILLSVVFPEDLLFLQDIDHALSPVGMLCAAGWGVAWLWRRINARKPLPLASPDGDGNVNDG